jgi:RIO kinase 1
VLLQGSRHPHVTTTPEGSITLHDEVFEHFLDEGLIEQVIRPIKSGKEASVHLCRANPRTTGETLAALKVFHPLDRRDFRDEQLYRDGEFIKERRIRTALEKKTKFGRQVQGGLWVHREWETLSALAAAGAPVPRPIERTDDAILMTYVGDLEAVAPQLRSYAVDDFDEAQQLFDQTIKAVELMLYHDVVHGDLSAYNLLVWEGVVTVIDFPQAVDAKKNGHAEAFLRRDVERVVTHFDKLGVRADVDTIAADLWTGWTLADLVPVELRGLSL